MPTPVDQLAPIASSSAALDIPGTQLSRISEGDENASSSSSTSDESSSDEYAPEQDAETAGAPGGKDAKGKAKMNDGAAKKVKVQIDKPFKILLQPLEPPEASFYCPSSKHPKNDRPLCPICLKEHAENWKVNKIGTCHLPFSDSRSFCEHFLQHFKSRRNTDRYLWDQEFECGMPGCAVQ